jgi:formylglycine-generating enzyme required for sulfatase activity
VGRVIFTFQRMNDPRINQLPGSLARTGAYGRCRSAWGAFDMVGNLHEWVADARGRFRGGFYADGETNGRGCWYVTTAHHPGYHDYSTGFRCCGDPTSVR